MDEEEQTPLISPTEQSASWKKWFMDSYQSISPKLLLSASALIILVIGYFLTYFWILPIQIQAAINGQGTLIRSVSIVSISPPVVDVELLIPIKDQGPVDVEVRVGELIGYSAPFTGDVPGTFGEIPIGGFDFPTIIVPASASTVEVNTTFHIKHLDRAWLSWFLRSGVKHGFPDVTRINLYGFPKVHIPALLATWPTKLTKNYYLELNKKPDTQPFNFTATEVEYESKNTPKGLQYIVSLTAGFTNSFPFSITPIVGQINFWVYYKGVPVLNIFTTAETDLRIEHGRNAKPIHILSKPEYGNELMELVGEISEGPANVTIKDISIKGNVQFIWIQDILDGLVIDITIPAIEDEYRDFVNVLSLPPLKQCETSLRDVYMIFNLVRNLTSTEHGAPYWNNPTSSVDWCEVNYSVTSYVAEYYNSISSVAMILVGLVGVYLHPWVESRFKVAFLTTSIVGLGSVAFHGTLSQLTQAFDEVPMLYSALAFLYITLNQRFPMKLHTRNMLALVLMSHAVITTYLVTAFEGKWQFLVFHLSFGSAEFYTIYQLVRIYRKHVHLQFHNRAFTRTFELGMLFYFSGFVFWLTDMLGCEYINPAYSTSKLSINPQFHAWWHISVSTGLYFISVFVIYDRLQSRIGASQPEIRYFAYMIPYVSLKRVINSETKTLYNTF
ncbi:ceramidase-domain-containing protein [Globomyces pollinis-pini]|nr:ceramidase-domain-containing protein [Globomyces pollinis-pini]